MEAVLNDALPSKPMGFLPLQKANQMLPRAPQIFEAPVQTQACGFSIILSSR